MRLLIGGRYIWRRIEVVITGLTRNQLYLTVPWVRIPPSPPNKTPHLGCFYLAEIRRWDSKATVPSIAR